MSLESIEILGSENAKLTLISTAIENGYKRYNFVLHNVTVSGIQNSKYNYTEWLKEIKFNFVGNSGAVGYIDNISLGNLK